MLQSLQLKICSFSVQPCNMTVERWFLTTGRYCGRALQTLACLHTSHYPPTKLVSVALPCLVICHTFVAAPFTRLACFVIRRWLPFYSSELSFIYLFCAYVYYLYICLALFSVYFILNGLCCLGILYQLL